MEEANLRYPAVTFYRDLDIADHLTIPEEWGAAASTSLKYGRMEYYLKDRIEPYLARPIQAILVNENADPYTELTQCAERTQREVVDPYNAEIDRTLAHR